MLTQSVKERYFQIGHISMCIQSLNTFLVNRVGNWLAQYEVIQLEHQEPSITMTLYGYDTKETIPCEIPTEAELLFKSKETYYYKLNSLWFSQLTSGTMIIDRQTNYIEAHVVKQLLSFPELLEDFMHPLLELFRQHGLFAYHAASVSRTNQGLLILGKSGQGKTTLSVDLLSHRFDFLSDDRCFLSEGDHHIDIRGYYEPVRYFPTNITHLKELSTRSKITKLPVLDNGKHQLDLHSIYEQKIIKKTQLTALVFPHFAPEETESRLEPVSPSEALITLLPLTMVCFDPETSRKHFQFCAKLTSHYPAVRLIMGKDRERWHKLIIDFLNAFKSKD